MKLSDLEGIERLLAENKLPTARVRESLGHFIIAEDRDADCNPDSNVLIGTIGLELFGDTALLRSTVIDKRARGIGVGTQLVEQLFVAARYLGVKKLDLLTTTAEEYFPRFGFARTTRDAASSSISAR